MISVLRNILFALAGFAYFVNGAQAHVSISQGEQIDLMLCSTGAHKSITLQLPGEPAEETTDTCCGDCTSATPVLVDAPAVRLVRVAYQDLALRDAVNNVSPRSPLWPGAPPQGPPSRTI